MKNISFLLAVLLPAMLVTSCSPGDTPGGGSSCQGGSLSTSYLWYGSARSKLNAMMADKGCKSPSYNSASKPLALFDWDNTVVKNDIGDGVMFYMLQNDQIKRPTTWATTSIHLTAAAITSLDTHCPIGTVSDPIATTTNLACATAIACIYNNSKVWDGTTTAAGNSTRCSGAAAFSIVTSGGASADTIEPAYAWTVSLQAGYTPAQIRTIAGNAFATRTSASIGATLTIGYVNDLTGYVRVYDQIKDLAQKLQDNGFDLWITTASSQYVVDAISQAAIGVPASKVIGVRSLLSSGVITADFESCGGIASGQHIINYRQGKRCWVNKIIKGMSDGAAQLTTKGESVFAAGDSDTDIFFAKDATTLRLAINRNKKELMCNAYENVDSKWIVNPMFIAPKGQQVSNYACGTVTNVNNTAIADQADGVYCSASTYDNANCNGQLN